MKQPHSEDYLNLVKSLAICAVVLGHIASPYTGFIFAWHMPLFFFLSGFFLRPGDSPTNFARANAHRLMIPYFAFGVLGIVVELVKRAALGRPIADLASYPAGLLFWMDYAHLNHYGFVLWFLPALLLAKLMAFALLRTQPGYLLPLVASFALAAIGLATGPLPFCIDTAMLAVPWIILGHVWFNRIAPNIGGYEPLLLVGALAYLMQAEPPALNLATSSLSNPPANYFYATSACLFIVLACKQLHVAASWPLVRLWGMNTMLIFVMHPYTNNAAHLLVENITGGGWPVKLLVSLILLQGLVLIKARFPRAPFLRWT